MKCSPWYKCTAERSLRHHVASTLVSASIMYMNFSHIFRKKVGTGCMCVCRRVKTLDGNAGPEKCPLEFREFRLVDMEAGLLVTRYGVRMCYIYDLILCWNLSCKMSSSAASTICGWEVMWSCHNVSLLVGLLLESRSADGLVPPCSSVCKRRWRPCLTAFTCCVWQDIQSTLKYHKDFHAT
jgi:hypothetical protein